MEPVTTSIVAALVAGAVAATKDVATSAIKDAYEGLKKLIIQRHEGTRPAVEKIAAEPSNEAAQQMLAKQLQESGVTADDKLKELATKLVDAVMELRGNPKAEPLFDFGELEVVRDLKMTNIESTRQILRATKAKVGQDFIVDGIRDKSMGTNNPKQ